jgi:hypothetical protein
MIKDTDGPDGIDGVREDNDVIEEEEIAFGGSHILGKV